MKSLLSRSAKQWNVSERVACLLFWIPIAGAVLLPPIRIVSMDLYRFLLIEDGPVEWLQFACFLAAGLLGFAVARREWDRRNRVYGVLFTFFALMMLFIAGEEISWGQRILGLETPEELDAINKQGEITAHNIYGVLDVFNLAVFVGSAWAATAWMSGRRLRLERLGRETPFVFVPPMFLMPAFTFVFLHRLARYTVVPQGGFTIDKYGEWGELCLAMALCVHCCLNYRRLAEASEAAAELVVQRT